METGAARKAPAAAGMIGSMIGRMHHVYADPAGHPFCLIPRPRWAPPIAGENEG